MIADDKDHPLETAVKLLTLPVWGPIYLAGVGIMKLSTALRRRKPKQEQQVEVLRLGCRRRSSSAPCSRR